MVDEYGPSYGAYHRLRVSQATTDLGAMFARMSGFDENSALALAMRYVVTEWRERSYVREPAGAAPRRRALTENRFLLEFDYSFRVRRLRFLQQRLDAVLAIVDHDARRDADYARDRVREAATARSRTRARSRCGGARAACAPRSAAARATRTGARRWRSSRAAACPWTR